MSEKLSVSKYKENFPNSKKSYTIGSSDDIKVPSREIKLSPTKDRNNNLQENKPIHVYESTGLYTDEDYNIDLEKGLKPTCNKWINNRGDTTSKDRSINSKLNNIKASLKSRVGKQDKNVSQMHYAKKGIITP